MTYEIFHRYFTVLRLCSSIYIIKTYQDFSNVSAQIVTCFVVMYPLCLGSTWHMVDVFSIHVSELVKE